MKVCTRTDCKNINKWLLQYSKAYVMRHCFVMNASIWTLIFVLYCNFLYLRSLKSTGPEICAIRAWDMCVSNNKHYLPNDDGKSIDKD